MSRLVKQLPLVGKRQPAAQHWLNQLAAAKPQTIHLRDGEVVVYRRSRSLLYQCRYKLAEGTWRRQSTGKASVEHAIARACDLYDEARYRQRLGLAHQTHSFAQIAAVTLAEQHTQTMCRALKNISCPTLLSGGWKNSHTQTDIKEFELWRDRQMQRVPKTSTLMNFASAWNRLIETAVSRGFISERVPVLKLTSRGEKGGTRPAFSKEEIDAVLALVETWQHKGTKRVEHEIRPLLRDYIEMLLYTRMRHGTEAMGIRWRDLEWHTKDGVRYLRIWVDGKTGGRWLIAKHKAVDVLKRLHARQKDICDLSFETTLIARVPHVLFRFSDGHQPHSLVGTFRKLMRDSGLLLDGAGQTRTLYSLRHTYATLALLEGGADIHTLSKQMGNSAAMIERHYSKLTATMAADKLA